MRVLKASVVIVSLGVLAALAWSTDARSVSSPAGIEVRPGDSNRPDAAIPAASRADVVSGVVVSAEGKAMKGASVQLRQGERPLQTTTTGARGWFAFEKVAPGVYEVTATAEGAAPATLRAAVGGLPGVPLRLTLGIPMQAGSVVSGSVWQNLAGTAASAPVATDMLSARAAPAAAAPVARRQQEAWLNPSIPSAGDFNTATYDRIEDNRFRRVADAPVSTFSTDVDTASYSNVRRFLNEGRLPPPDAVRIEELINYFGVPYEQPRGDAPLGVSTEVAACPWSPRHRLALVALQARRAQPSETPARNLVFLLDVSGSMTPADRLPLVITGMRILADTLTARDRVAIVVYAGASGLVLPATAGDRKADIHRALASLQAGGSTNGAEGIQLAYDTAAASFVTGGVNRVILATDGDFNVGITSQGDLVRLIEQQRERGIFLSVLGVGNDNLKDSTMEKLADRGNGNYSYLDSLDEARRVLISEAASTLVTVAKDVKIQVEFNPHTVAAYRLVGYENRMLAREDFNDDRKDAGDVGAGRRVTALYELIPAGEPVDGPAVDPLKYQQPAAMTSRSGELMTVKVRYKQPLASVSQVMAVSAHDHAGEPGATLGFAAAVAEYGMLLRDSEFKGDATWTSAQTLARRHRGDDVDGYRAEFVRLVDLAAALHAQETPRQTRR